MDAQGGRFPWGRIAVTLFACLVLTAAAGLAAESDTLRVGAWNLERLGSPWERDHPRQRRSNGFGVSRDPRRLAEVIGGLRIDVLALSEIDDRRPGDRRRSSELLDQAFAILNRDPGRDWRYRLFAGREKHSGDQLTGLAWNRERVRAVGRPLRIAVRDPTPGAFSEWHRHPHAMHFSCGPGRTDFVVVPVHMKAGRSGRAVDQREREARALVAALTAVRAHFGDEDIVLAGDFNLSAAREPAGAVYREEGGFFDLNFSDRATHVSRRPLDRAYIPRSQQRAEFAGLRRLEIFAPRNAGQRKAFRRQLSDHWPVVLEFSCRPDDD